MPKEIVPQGMLARPDAITHLRPIPGHLSFSQITSLAPRYKYSCARRWAYSKLMGLDDDEVVSYLLVVGKVLDEAVTELLSARKFYKTEPEQRLVYGGTIELGLLKAKGEAPEQDPAVRQDKWALWPDRKKVADYERVVREAAVLLYTELAEVRAASVQPKHEWHMRVEPGSDEVLTVVGYSDWIDQDGVVNDLKVRGTSPVNKAGEWDEGWLSPVRKQLTSYYLARKVYAAKLSLPEPPALGRIHVVTHNLKLKAPQYHTSGMDFDSDDIEELIEDAREAYRRQHAPTHPPSPGDACTFCSFRVRCAWDSARFAPLTTQLVEEPK